MILEDEVEDFLPSLDDLLLSQKDNLKEVYLLEKKKKNVDTLQN